MQPPPIDNRSEAELAAETGALLTRLTGWQPAADGRGDPGHALVGVFARYAHLVAERLNRLPEKNFLAFLNLIGAEPVTPQPARVPLTFTLADGAPVDGVVPAGTQVAAPPRPGDEDEAVFETEQELLVSRARLTAARVYDPWTDRTADCRAALGGEGPTPPFPVFAGAEAVEHDLFLACDPVLADAAGRAVRLDVFTPDSWQWQRWPIAWSAWQAGAWQPLSATTRYVSAEGRWEVAVAALPELEATTVAGVEARWLRARLGLPMPPGRLGLTPGEAGPVPVERPAALAFPLRPFGPGDQPWLLDGGDVFDRAGAVLALDVTVAPGAAATANLAVEWDHLAPDGTWVVFGRSGRGAGQPVAGTPAADAALADGTGGLITSGRIELRLPGGWGRQDQLSRRGRWLRARVVTGRYDSAPTVTDLRLGWRWELPRVERILVTAAPPPEKDPASPLPPEMGSRNGVPADLSRDVSPFGAEPAFNDTFAVACEPVLATPGATVQVVVTLTNPARSTTSPVPVVRTDGNPVVAWEMCTAQGWRSLATSPATVPAAGSPLSLTASGTLTLSVPADVVPVAVGGEERHWLRARLIGGHYGVAASYTGDADAGYTLVPATFAPPFVQSLRFSVTAAPPAPGQVAPGAQRQAVTGCATVNGGAPVDHTAAAAAADGTMFTPFEPLAVTEPSLYLGFDRAVSPRLFNLFVEVEPPRPEDVAAEMLLARPDGDPLRVAWEYSRADGWAPLGPIDETAGFTRSGLVRFVGPDDAAPRSLLGQELHWLAARWRGGDPLFAPRARQLRLDTVWAAAAVTFRDENLGSARGEPGQQVTALHAPVLPGEVLEVEEEAGHRVVWRPVGDFLASGPADRHYTIDRRTGEITFGDGRRGRIPPAGAGNLRLAFYRSGGGEAGNRGVGEIVNLKSSPPYVDGVSNPVAAGGGFDEEPLARVKERGPASLRHQDRAVTSQDLADLAVEASPDVARVSVIAPAFDSGQLWLAPGARPRAGHRAVPAGQLGLVVVPHGTEARPTPGLDLLDTVRRHVTDRASPAGEIWVAGPEWVAVAVQARVAPAATDRAEAVTADARRALDAFLHPLTGGFAGRGWPFGAVPRRSDLYRVLEATPGVDHVRSLSLTVTPITSRGNVDELRAWLLRRESQTAALTPDQREWNSWAQRSLVYAAEHTVRAVLDA